MSSPNNDVVNLRRALEYIKEHFGQVCDDFMECKHPSCNASCGSWLVAEGALEGRYPWDSETQAAEPLDF
jgi:hypothetical protein